VGFAKRTVAGLDETRERAGAATGIPANEPTKAIFLLGKKVTCANAEWPGRGEGGGCRRGVGVSETKSRLRG